MNPQSHIQILRTQLLAMSRVSQRSLDYSVKGYQLHVDFARHAVTAGDEIVELDRRIRNLSRGAVNEGIANASDFRFAFAALSIATALRTTYSAASEIALSTMCFLEGNQIERSAVLERKAQSVNAAMRLCTVALFERNACYARTVLQNHERSAHLFEVGNCELHSDRGFDPLHNFERTVARGLGEVAKQTRDMADALLFWLEGNAATSAVPTGSMWHRAEDATLYVQSGRDLNQKASQSFSC